MNEENTNNLSRQFCKDTIFAGYIVLSPTGEAIFSAKRRKIDFYINNNLAHWVDNKTIQLDFEPNGMGAIERGLPVVLKNQCVICGQENKDLTLHHIFPVMYGRYVSNKIYREIVGDDIQAVCVKCHRTYESKYAQPLKKQIEKNTGVPLDGIGWEYVGRKGYIAIRDAIALVRYGNKIPNYKKQEMKAKITDWLQREPTNNDISKLAEKPSKFSSNGWIKTEDHIPHGKFVIDRMTESKIRNFIYMWRKHFIDCMQPQYLPEGWKLELHE